MSTEAGWDYYLAASPSPLDSCSSSADGSRRSSAARLAFSLFPAAVVGAPAFVLVSAAVSAAVAASATVGSAAAVAAAAGSVALAAYCPVDSAPNSRAVPAQSTAQPAPSTIPRIGVSVSLLVTSSDSRRFLHRLAPAAADPSAARNSTKHQNSPAPAGSGLSFRLRSHSAKAPEAASPATPSPAPASTQQTPLAATARTIPTSFALPAPPPLAPARVHQTPPTARSSAPHPATHSPREIRSRATGTARTSRDVSPSPTVRLPSGARPHTP